MQEWILFFIVHNPLFVYAFMGVFSCIEGPILSVLGGVFLHSGYLQFWPLYAVLMLGDLFGDTVWYLVGRHFGMRFVNKFGKYWNITAENIAVVEKIFHKYKDGILLVSKLTMGFGFSLVTLITAGMVRIPYRRYISLNAFAQFFWTGFLIAVGYLFSNLYATIDNIFGKISFFGLLTVALIGLYGFGKYVRMKISNMK